MLLLHVLQCARLEGCCLVIEGWNANIAMPSQLVSEFWRGRCSGGSYPHQLGVTASTSFSASIYSTKVVPVLAYHATQLSQVPLSCVFLKPILHPTFCFCIPQYPWGDPVLPEISTFQHLSGVSQTFGKNESHLRPLDGSGGTRQNQTSCSARNTQAQVNITHIWSGKWSLLLCELKNYRAEQTALSVWAGCKGKAIGTSKIPWASVSRNFL